MGIENDIQRLFAGVLDEHGGNKAAAAASLDVNAVTFWGWTTGKRKPPSALCKAIDSAGGKLLLPGEFPPASPDQSRDIESLKKEIGFLTRENALLTKLVNKYDAEEREKKEASPAPEATAGRPVQSSGDVAGYER